MWGPWLFLLGMFMGAAGLMNIGIWLFAAASLFQLVTLPVECEASNRALSILRKMNFLDDREIGGARAVLTAAAMTYVAALANSLATILHYVAIMNSQRE